MRKPRAVPVTGMAKPVHSMIRVLDEARSLDFYARAFELRIADSLVFEDFALIYLRHASSPFELELTVNFGRKEPYVQGDGYGHLAVVVDNLDAEHARYSRSEEHTSELQSPYDLVCRLLLEKKKKKT